MLNPSKNVDNAASESLLLANRNINQENPHIDIPIKISALRWMKAKMEASCATWLMLLERTSNPGINKPRLMFTIDSNQIKCDCLSKKLLIGAINDIATVRLKQT